MTPTHRARPFEVVVRAYRPGAGMEDGFLGVSLNDYVRGEAVVMVGEDGYELTTENLTLAQLSEKVRWVPGANLLPFRYVRGGARHAIWPGWFLVRFPGGIEIPMGPNEVTQLFEALPAKEGDEE